MADTTIYIKKEGTTYQFVDSAGTEVTSETIDNNTKLVIDIGSGFSPSAEITTLSLYNDSNGSKGTFIASWATTAPNQQPSTAIRVSNNGTGIKITDTNSTNDEIDYYFCVAGTDGGTPFTADPELKVKRTAGGGG